MVPTMVPAVSKVRPRLKKRMLLIQFWLPGYSRGADGLREGKGASQRLSQFRREAHRQKGGRDIEAQAPKLREFAELSSFWHPAQGGGSELWNGWLCWLGGLRWLLTHNLGAWPWWLGGLAGPRLLAGLAGRAGWRAGSLLLLHNTLKNVAPARVG